jgi:hypothetical protein
MVKRRRTATRKSTKRTTRRTRKSTMRGKGVLDVLKAVRDSKIVSRGLGLINNPYAQAASSVVGLLGGRRKRTTRRAPRRSTMPTGMHGKGIFSDLGGGLGSVFRGIGGGLFGNGAKGTIAKRARRVIKI